MRKSKYLILNSLYFNFINSLDDIIKIYKFKESFKSQNILDLLRFNKLSNIIDIQIKSSSINFIYLPNNIKEIQSAEFKNCNVIYVNFSNLKKLKEISNNSFENNNMKILNLSNCVKLNLIDFDSFKNSKIKQLKLPNNIKNICTNAFNNNNIKYLDLSNCYNVIIEDDAFFENPLKEIKIQNQINIFYSKKNYNSIWYKFVTYYNKIGKQDGNYKYENNQWKWYPL